MTTTTIADGFLPSQVSHISGNFKINGDNLLWAMLCVFQQTTESTLYYILASQARYTQESKYLLKP